MTKMRIALGVLSVAMLASCTKDVRDSNSDPANLNQADASISAASGNSSDLPHVPNEILVKFKNGTSEKDIEKALAKINGKSKEKIRTKMMERSGDDGIYLIKTPLAAIEATSKIKGVEVEFAEPNYIYTHDAVSNDALFTNGSLWGMYGASTSPANQFGSNAAAAWAAGRTGSSTVYIGIIDEGAMWGHNDLAGNFGNPNEIASDNIDNDGNGYVDDVYGWDFVSNDNSTYDGSADDHGTHVAGTIGAVGGNNQGVAGVCWNVKMLSAKFLGANGGTTANAIKAVDYFTDLKKKGLNIVATNNSWGGGGYSQGLYDAIERAKNAGILFIAAAGNGGSDGRGDNIDGKRAASYPASYTNTNIIGVAAISSSGALASFSNYGVTSVDIGAPGVGINSTLPGNTYGSYSGTSMATPHVAGAVALYASVKPGATADQIKNAILSGGTPTTSLSNRTVTGRRLDANASLSR